MFKNELRNRTGREGDSFDVAAADDAGDRRADSTDGNFAGDVAGEISISGISPPIATVTAETDVEVIAFPSESMNRCIEKHPEFGRRLRESAIRRIAG